MVAEIDSRHIVGNRLFFRGNVLDLVGRDEQELGLRVHELADQPRAGDAVHLDALTGYPLHDGFLPGRATVEPSTTIGTPTRRTPSSRNCHAVGRGLATATYSP